MSGWPGVRTVERDLPPNMREMGDSTELAYSRPCIISDVKFNKRIIGAPRTLAFPPQFGPRLVEPQLRIPLHLQ